MCQCSTARCWCWRCRGGAGVGSVRSWKGVKGKSISEYLMQLDDFLKTNQCSQTLLSHLMFWFSCVCEASLGENTQCSSPRTDQSVSCPGAVRLPKPFGDPFGPSDPTHLQSSGLAAANGDHAPGCSMALGGRRADKGVATA